MNAEGAISEWMDVDHHRSYQLGPLPLIGSKNKPSSVRLRSVSGPWRQSALLTIDTQIDGSGPDVFGYSNVLHVPRRSLRFRLYQYPSWKSG